MNPIRIKTPLTKDVMKGLKCGDEVLLSGIILTARDAAHKRLFDIIKKGKNIPLNLKDAVIYYAGPTPPPPRRAIGSCGTTTSSRLDPFTVPLRALGLRGMIGKGDRNNEVRSAIKKYGAVYFIAIGGLATLANE